MLPTIIDEPLPDDQAPGWVHARSWITFFRAIDARENVWMRVVTRVLDSEAPVEVQLCGTPEGYHARVLGCEKSGCWLHLTMSKLYPDLRKALSCKSEFLDRTAIELGLGLK